MTTNSSLNVIRFEDIVSEINPVAMIGKEYTEISQSHNLKFQKSYDDLDYLYFATLSLPSKNRVSLLRHIHSPKPGTEICVSYEQSNIPNILTEVFFEMNLTRSDFLWIHEKYEKEVFKLINKQNINQKNIYNSQFS